MVIRDYNDSSSFCNNCVSMIFLRLYTAYKYVHETAESSLTSLVFFSFFKWLGLE